MLPKLKVKSEKLGTILVNAGLITREQLDQALEEQKKTSERLGKVLVKLGFIEEREMVNYLGSQLGIPYVEISKLEPIDPGVIKAVPEFITRHQLILPISRQGNVLTIAMTDPFNILAIDDIRLMTGYEVKTVISTEEEIKQAIDKYYGKVDMVGDLLKEIESEKIDVVEEREEAPEEVVLEQHVGAPMINLVNHILVEAIKAGASDIHIESYEKNLRVRYRIDGVLYEVLSPPKYLHAGITTRIKVMANLDIAERRRPQDGRCKVRLHGKNVDLRVSVSPTNFGEKIVIRILDASSLCLDLTMLGFEPDDLEIFERMIRSPYGMILVTGPTGSGKSTTLYSSLNKLNSVDKNIMTIEDPVEYVLEGVNQVQVKPQIGLTFASGLRSFLRQDPDIILVGEIRDKETAEVAVNAALTGHLVFATLHTNDAPGAITRLINMGVEPFLISSTVIMCVAQRLIRSICTKCKEPYEVPVRSLREAGIYVDGREMVTLYRGAGCKNCNNLGYKGRVAIFELMVINEHIRELILNKESASVIGEAAKAAGMSTLHDAGVKKVLAGVTTIEELMRVTFREGEI